MNTNTTKPLDSVEQTEQGKNSPAAHLDPVIYDVPKKVEATTHITPVSTNAEGAAPLLNHEESEHFRILWNEIQGKFVDEPRSAVQQADALVSEVIEKITKANAAATAPPIKVFITLQPPCLLFPMWFS